MNSSRNQVVNRALKTVLFVANRNRTTSLDLAKELGTSRKQARRYLEALEQETQLLVTEDEDGQYLYCFGAEWKKRHKVFVE